jgi:hypothetical protein
VQMMTKVVRSPERVWGDARKSTWTIARTPQFPNKSPMASPSLSPTDGSASFDSSSPFKGLVLCCTSVSSDQKVR